jgi:hypothetical protein
MTTRVKLELDPQTFGRLVESAVSEQRPADWQAEVILRRALGTWNEQHIGTDVPAAGKDGTAPAGHEDARVPA